MNYGKKHDLPFGIMDVAGLLRLNIRRRAPGQVYVDCPICGDRRGKMNLNTEKDLWRCNYCGEGGGMLSLYAKVYGVSNSDAYREICDALAVNGFSPDYTVSEKTTPAEAEQSDAASVQEVHQTLSMLLSMLTLIPAHHTHLQSVRGLSDDEITRFGFKSTPPPFLCRSLTNRLVKAGCRVQGVPGFYVDDNGCWTVKFHQRTSGIIIPIFGVDGLIRGAQIRLDHPLKDKDDPPEKTGVKYLTLSSTGKRMGTTSGSPIHFVGDPCSRVVYVTEGCLKADVAHALMHRTFVATLGANNTAKLDGLFAFLHRNGTEEIIEAEDMDKYSNEMVGKGASKIYALAARHGMRCRRLTWNPNYTLGLDKLGNALFHVAPRQLLRICGHTLCGSLEQFRRAHGIQPFQRGLFRPPLFRLLGVPFCLALGFRRFVRTAGLILTLGIGGGCRFAGRRCRSRICSRRTCCRRFHRSRLRHIHSIIFRKGVGNGSLAVLKLVIHI